jgi:hypothetical protein
MKRDGCKNKLSRTADVLGVPEPFLDSIIIYNVDVAIQPSNIKKVQ